MVVALVVRSDATSRSNDLAVWAGRDPKPALASDQAASHFVQALHFYGKDAKVFGDILEGKTEVGGGARLDAIGKDLSDPLEGPGENCPFARERSLIEAAHSHAALESA